MMDNLFKGKKMSRFRARRSSASGRLIYIWRDLTVPRTAATRNTGGFHESSR
jgi:hypothetical protein